jgi:hypothetical protein
MRQDGSAARTSLHRLLAHSYPWITGGRAGAAGVYNLYIFAACSSPSAVKKF